MSLSSLFDVDHQFGNGLELLICCESKDYSVMFALLVDRLQKVENDLWSLKNENADLRERLSNLENHKPCLLKEVSAV